MQIPKTYYLDSKTFSYLFFLVPDVGLKAVASYCPWLRELSVSECHGITDEGVAQLSRYSFYSCVKKSGGKGVMLLPCL